MARRSIAASGLTSITLVIGTLTHGSGPRVVLPPAFYDQPHLAAALATLEFSPVLLAVRAHQHWSQQTLGEYLGLAQCRISDIEKGRRHLAE